MKFFNSSKKWRFASSSITKYILAALLSLAGVQGVLAQNPENTWTLAGSMNDWIASDPNYAFVRQDVSFAGNNYTNYLDLEFPEAGSFEYKLVEAGNNWYGMTTTINNTCKWWEWKSDGGNTTFNYNAGKYRFYINANSDQRRITVTGIFVTIEEPVQNADGSYTITGRFTNANPGQQNIHTYQIVFSEGLGQGVGTNENATDNGDGSFSITKRLVEGQRYTCCARAIDGSIGNHDSEYITFTAEAATPEPEPTVTDLYIFGVDNWQSPAEDWKYTSVSEDGNVYTWDWPAASKTIAADTYFKIGAKNAANDGIDDNNNYGPSGSDVLLNFDGVQSVIKEVVNSKESKAFYVSEKTKISKIVFDKSDLTVTFYTPEETQDPVYAATITADASASQQTARQVALTSLLTEAAAGTDLTSATCQFQYLSADAAEGTEYSNLDAPVAYNADGTSLTTTALPQGGKYLFRAVWTLNGEVVATSEPSEATCVYPVTPNSNMFAVQWEFATDPATLDVTITANIGVVEGSCLTMEQISKAPLECEIFVNEDSYRPQQTELVGDVMKATLTVAGLNASDGLDYRIVLVTGAANASVVLAQGNMQIPGGTYVDRYPVTLNIVNGETGGTVITDPEDISSLAIGETVTVTANANEGYVPVFEATSGVTMTDGTSDNVKVFTITGANPVITVTFQVQCQTFEPGFAISGQFNAGVSDGGGLYEGKAVESGEADPANGYWSDGARFIQLTANNVPANYFEWVCTGYAIDGVDQETVPEIAWTDQYKNKTSARAELSQPGTYTFVCKAKCNEADEWTESAAITITAPVPEMGFNGNIVTNHEWGNPEWAGQADGGYMTRRSGYLMWVSNPFTVDGFGIGNLNYHFVIDQRYKFLGCVKQNGWTENNECNDLPGDGNNKDNKINRSNLTFENVAWDGERGANFAAINPGAWVANETQLQLVVTMTRWDSYTVALEEVSQECTTPADNFAISARLNQGSGEPFEGNLVASGSNTATGGYFADDFRTVTLTTTQVADTYQWQLVSYAIDGNVQATADLTALAAITNGDAQTATALLNRPGDYTFQCTAACTDGTPVNSATVTISTYPEMGFDGPIGTPANLTTENNGWNHAWAAEENNGLLERQSGTLTWTNTFTYQHVNNLTDFVVIQRYKLGCVATPKGYEGRPEYLGWAGHDECPGQSIVNSGNKINASANISFQGYAVSSNPGEQNMNFIASGEKVSSWISGETQLTLTVTMTDWDSYTVELTKKQEQIYANYSSNDEAMGTVTMKVGDTQIDNGDEITDYIGQQVTLIATPAQGYKVASWKINGKETVSNTTTIKPTLSGDDLIVVVTFERDCYAGVAYDLTGDGVICAKGGSTELSLNTLNNVTYQLYKNGAPYGEAVPGNGEAAKWTISEAGTYTAKSYDSRFGECQEQAIDMNGSAVVTTVTAPAITVNPGDNVHLTVLQARSFTAKVPVDGSITDVTGSGARNAPMNTIPVDWSITEVTGSGDYCEGDGYMISSQTDTSLVAKFLCIGTAKITATMKAPNQNCKAVVTVHQNGAETEVCAPEPEDMQ